MSVIGSALVTVTAAAVLLLLALGLLYNRLVTTRNRYENAFAQIDVQLKRRHDLIPNLVTTVREYLQYERETLTAVTAARARATAAAAAAAAAPGGTAVMRELSGAEGALTGALGRLAVSVEKYPDLKANATTLRLMEELASAENRVGFARQAYNDAVTVYNTACQTVPGVLVARPLGFVPAALFVIDDEAQRAVPQVAAL
ncbi:MAG TPA: LemA family protein [bacterium]|nr:LemA family protein [bacterium]